MQHTQRQFGPATRRPAHQRPGNTPHRFWPFATSPKEAPPEVPHTRDGKLATLEAALFLADEPLPVRRLTEAVGLADAAETRGLLKKLQRIYDEDLSPYQIEEIGGGFQILTRAVYHPWLVRLRRTSSEVRLSSAALETLAVIAYRQPITRAEVEVVRGVNCSEVIRLLMEKGMVKVGGRHDSLGRPQLYVTTKKFLQVYGMNTLADLPEIESLKRPKG